MRGKDDTLTKGIDDLAHGRWARITASLSPISSGLAALDWASHLALSPGKRLSLFKQALSNGFQLVDYAHACATSSQPETVEPPIPGDRRFREPGWSRWPYNVMHQSFLMQQRWWDQVTTDVWGVEPHHQRVVNFAARQWLDMISPGNWLMSNPVVLERTREEQGENLKRGFQHLLDDFQRLMSGQPPAGADNFEVGRDVAITPGKVVLRNRLMELIQYAPTTDKVHPEPVLIVPAWIMKYYILDLSEQNSLIRYLVDNGFTVFCISWKNPGVMESQLGMDDYLEQGIHAALSAIQTIVPSARVHAAGYCLGGTLLAIAAAAMGRDGQLDALASMTLLAAQTDFSEPGELALFIDESQVSLLEAQMQQTGYLRADQMSSAFQMLRSYDLLWSRLVKEYLLGERPAMSDLMAWNADATRMPARMHSEYLRRLFLNDDLSEGRYPVNGKPVSLSALTLPIFSVGTTTDHVAPWRSVYKLHHLCPAEITFVLTTGGHNAGIVSQPGHPRRQFQRLTRPACSEAIAVDDWLEAAPTTKGSWWPAWAQWLAERSTAKVKPPHMGAARKGYAPIADAPGEYVQEK